MPTSCLVKLIKFAIGAALLAAVSACIFALWGARAPNISVAVPGELVNLDGAPVPTHDLERLRIVAFDAGLGMFFGREGFNIPPPDVYYSNVRTMARAVGANRPDIVVAYNVILDGRWSHALDMMAAIAIEGDLHYRLVTTSWSRNFALYPDWRSSQHLGRIDAGVVIYSRHPILEYDGAVVEDEPDAAMTRQLWGPNNSWTSASVQIGPDRTMNLAVVDGTSVDGVRPAPRGDESGYAIIVSRDATHIEPPWNLVSGDDGEIHVGVSARLSPWTQVTHGRLADTLHANAVFVELGVDKPTP